MSGRRRELLGETVRRLASLVLALSLIIIPTNCGDGVSEADPVVETVPVPEKQVVIVPVPDKAAENRLRKRLEGLKRQYHRLKRDTAHLRRIFKPVGIALRYRGVPYVWGGESPSGFDCSGLVRYVYRKVGVLLPHHAASQYGYGKPVSRNRLQPGDLVFFNGLGHVGIYIGLGHFIQAPHSGDVVRVTPLTGWYRDNYVGARRVQV
jgi:hypothetical protein